MLIILTRELKINKIFKYLQEAAQRFFPDRQLYFRSNGDVRFVSITQKTQIFTVSVLICLSLWFVVTSYNYIYIYEILDTKNQEVNVANQNYQTLEQQYTQLKNDIEKSTAVLEQRQGYIQQVLEEEALYKTPENNVLPLINESGTAAKDDIVTDGDDNDKEAKNLIRNESLDRIYVDLKHVEMWQNNTVRTISKKIDNKLTFLKETLENAGLKETKILELAQSNTPSSMAAQGGPFIAVEEEGFDNNAVNNQTFDDLYTKRNNLKELELAIAFLPISTPPEKFYVSSKFGVRRDPITKKWATHKGIDMAGWTKTPIGAGGDGVVIKAGRNGAFGLFIEIDHGNGFRSRYGHLSKLKVKRGDKVVANQLIGLMGSTGRSTSTHLHYEIWFNGNPIDPLKVLKAAKDVQKIKQQQYNS